MMSEPRKRILVVDDEENWLKTIKNMLGAEYDLTLKSEPEEAIRALEKEEFSLVILDMKFPDGRQGSEIFQEMQKTAPELRAIILTGHPDIDDAVTSFRLGLRDYLKKGSDKLLNELKERIKQNLRTSEVPPIEDLIKGGESEVLEFKSSARWDIRANKVNKELEKAIVKTIAAFFNSQRGGRLLIGVDDNGNIVGIEQDYNTLVKKDLDGYEGYLTNLLLDAFGKELSLWLDISFHEVDQKGVCLVTARPSQKPVFVTDDKAEHLYIRTGNSTRLLSTREAIEYCKVRWKS